MYQDQKSGENSTRAEPVGLFLLVLLLTIAIKDGVFYETAYQAIAMGGLFLLVLPLIAASRSIVRKLAQSKQSESSFPQQSAQAEDNDTSRVTRKMPILKPARIVGPRYPLVVAFKNSSALGGANLRSEPRNDSRSCYVTNYK